MTRETKIGLVVACSFLCLVGVVVASKWKRGDDPSEEQTVVIAANKPAQVVTEHKAKEGAPKSEKKAAPPAPASPTFPPLPAPETKKGDAPPVFDPLPLPVPPPLSINSSAVSDEEAKKRLREAMNPAPAVPLPIPTPGPMQLVESKPLVLGSNTNPAGSGPLPLPSAVDVKPAGPTPSVPLPGPAPIGPVETAPKPFVPFEDKKPLVLTPPDPLKAGAAGTIEVPPPLAPLAPPGKESAPIKPELKPFGPLATEPATVSPVPGVPQLAPLTKEPAPTIGARELPSTPPISTNPTIPPMAVGGNQRPLPAVKDSSLSVHECKPGETTFPVLSMRLYGTDSYANALQAYNRAHSGAVKNGFNFNFNPPILNPGQQVLFPPKDLLDRDYRNFITSSTAGTIPTPPGPAATVKLTVPTPLSPPGGIATISNPPSISPAGAYKVQNPAGESILDIAERVLGNRGRWTDIYRLNQANPTVQPQFRIPAGTELKMPAS